MSWRLVPWQPNYEWNCTSHQSHLLQALISAFEYLWRKALTYLSRAKSENILQPEMPQAREVRHPCRAETQSCPHQETIGSPSMPGCGSAGISTGKWQLRIKVSPLRHVGTMCSWFCFCSSALESCLTAAKHARFLNSHVSKQAVLSWALGVLGHPFSLGSLHSCLWSLFPMKATSLWVSDNCQTGVPVPSSVGLWIRFDIYFGFSYFPCFPKKEAHTKESRSATWSCLYSCTCKAAEKISLDAWEDKLFQDERGYC